MYRVNRHHAARRFRAPSSSVATSVAAVTLPLLAAHVAHAQTWNWTGGAGSPFNWSAPGNWSTGAPPNNGTADLNFAVISGATNVINVPYAARTVTLNTAFPFPVAWSVSGSTLTLGSGGLRSLSTVATSFSAPIVLAAPTSIQTTAANFNLLTGSNTIALGGFALSLTPSASRTLTVQHALTGTGSVQLNGAGTVTWSGAQSNTYSGPLTVSAGTLVLQRTGAATAANDFGLAVPGDLTINDATVRLLAFDQISDAATVTLTGANSRLVLENVADSVALLRLAPGALVTGTGFGTLSLYSRPGTVAMTGTSGTATVASRFDAFTNTATFSAPAGGTLAFTGEFIQEGPLLKTGAGLVRVGGGGVPVTLAAPVDVREGSLRVEFPGAGAVTGVTVGTAGGASLGSLELVSDNPFGGAPVPLVVHPGSTLTLTPQTAAPYTLRTSSALLFSNSVFSVPNSTTWEISGTTTLVNNVGGPNSELFITPASVSVSASGATLSAGFSAPANANDISATLFTRVTGGPLTKTGPGWIVANLSAGSSLTGLDVTAGRLDVAATGWLVPGSIVNVTSGTLTVNGRPTSGSTFMRLAVGPGGALNASSMSLQPIGPITLDSGVVTLLGGASIALTGTATGVVGGMTLTVATVTTSGSVTSGVPRISGPGPVGPNAAPPALYLRREFSFFDVQPLTGGPAAFDFMLQTDIGRFPENASINTWISKVGQGRMLWEGDDFLSTSISVPLEVVEGTLVIRDRSPGTTGRANANIARGGTLEFENAALDPSAGLYAYLNGRIVLRADVTAAMVDVFGGTLSTTGSTLSVGSHFFFASNGQTAPLLDADVRLLPGASLQLDHSTDGPAPAFVVTRRFINTPGTAMMFSDASPPKGLSFRVTDPLAGTPANLPGPAFPGPLIIVGGFSVRLERSTSTPANPATAFGVTVSGSGSSLVVARPAQVAAGTQIVLENLGRLDLSLPAGPAPVRALDGAGITVVGSSTPFVRVTTPTADATGRTAAPVVTVLSNLSVINFPTVANGRQFLMVFDLGTNDLVLRNANATLYREMARNFLTSAGTRGLGTTAGIPHTALAVVQNVDSSGLPLFNIFDGVDVTAADVLVKFTWAGDTDLNGVLDARDVNAVLNGWSNNLTGWRNGDVNHDGLVDATDWSLFFAAYSAGLPSLGSPSDFGSSGGGGGGEGGGAIPEPAALATLTPVALALSRRRRHLR